MSGDLYHGQVPAGAVYVGRPAPGLRRSKWANPFKNGRPTPDDLRLGGLVLDGTSYEWRSPESAAEAVAWFRDLVDSVPGFAGQIRIDLAGRDLACWCPLDAPCHADVLLQIANPPAENPLDGAMHSVWLHGNWGYLTKQMTTEEREAAADAVLRYDRAMKSGETAPELLDADNLRWWR